jgi:hypothetical protein
MITSELENELRRTFALADAQITVPGQARQRLLGRDYHPRRRNRRLATGITAAAAAAALVLILGLSGAIGSAPAHRTGTIRTAAFTLAQNASGTATLTINPRVLFEAATLQRDLERDHIPAMVTAGSFCSSNPAPPGFSQVISIPIQPRQHPVKVTINPAAMPAGTKLSFGHFQLATSQQTSIALIDTGSYTCTGTAPTALPSGGGALLRYSGGTS